MVKAQEYLDQHYPCNCNERDEYNNLIYQKNCPRNTQELNLRQLNLTGDLDLGGFNGSYENPLKIYLTGNPQLGEIKNKPYFSTLIYQNLSEWLNHQYPQPNQVEIIDLNNLWNIEFEQPGGQSSEDLTNASQLTFNNYPNLKKIKKDYYNVINNITKINITNCPQLETINIRYLKNNQQLILHNLPKLNYLDCSDNNLTTLDLSDCANLQTINCSNNQLTQIKLPKGEKLTELNLRNNNFQQDLSFGQDLVNLRELRLSNNYFQGSLEYLKDLNELKRLDIRDTDLDSGLEYLPENVERFYCSVDIRKDAKCQTFQKQLKGFANEKNFLGQDKNEEYYGYNPQKWRKANKKLIAKLNQTKLEEQLKQLQEQKEKLLKRISDLETLTQESQRLIREQKQKIANHHYHFFTEEEKIALQELIKIHRTYEEAKKIKENTNKLYKQLFSLRQKLETKLGEEFMEAVQSVLTDLEELYQREWDLQNQLKEKEQSLTTKQLIEENIEKNKQALRNLTIEVKGNLLLENVNVKGNSLIGCQLGDNTDLSHNKHATIEEVCEEFEAQILHHPPKTN